jgi:hypothetical protein
MRNEPGYHCPLPFAGDVEAFAASRSSNSLEFEGIEIRGVNPLPDTEASKDNMGWSGWEESGNLTTNNETNLRKKE